VDIPELSHLNYLQLHRVVLKSRLSFKAGESYLPLDSRYNKKNKVKDERVNYVGWKYRRQNIASYDDIAIPDFDEELSDNTRPTHFSKTIYDNEFKTIAAKMYPRKKGVGN